MKVNLHRLFNYLSHRTLFPHGRKLKIIVTNSLKDSVPLTQAPKSARRWIVVQVDFCPQKSTKSPSRGYCGYSVDFCLCVGGFIEFIL